MPVVGTRKSTKVFVPKAAAVAAEIQDEPVAVVLRSGKRLLLSRPSGTKVEAGEYGNEWIRLFGVPAEAAEVESVRCGQVHNSVSDRRDVLPGNHGGSCGIDHNDEGMDLHARRFGCAYNRKRKRLLPENDMGTSCSAAKNSSRYGLTYVRREGSKKMKLSLEADRVKDFPTEEVVLVDSLEHQVAKEEFQIPLPTTGKDSEECNLSLEAESTNGLLTEEVVLVESLSPTGGVTGNDSHKCAFPSDTKGINGLPEEGGFEPIETSRCEQAEQQFEIPEPARRFADKFGILGTKYWSRQNNLVALLVLVDLSVKESVCLFSQFFVAVLAGMRRERMKLLNLVCFLLSKPIGGVFSRNGIHFLAVRLDCHDFCRNTHMNAGMCRISGSETPVPLLSVNFLALPSYFKNLHIVLSLRSRFMPVHRLSRHLRKPCQGNPKSAIDSIIVGSAMADMDQNIILPAMSKSVGPPVQSASIDLADSCKEVVKFQSAVAGVEVVAVSAGLNTSEKLTTDGELHHVRETGSAPQSMPTRRSMITRSQKKRTSLRSARRRPTYHKLNRYFADVSLRVKSKAVCRADSSSGTIPDFCEPSESGYQSISFSSSNGIATKPSERSCDDKLKDLKSVVTEIKQKIDSISCKASILVIEPDRCWREEGAEVMLGSSESGDWYLSVKVNGSIRYMHRPQEGKSSVLNRYTHSMIWTGGGSWKLEFDDRMDWMIFKQLHLECLERNFPDGSSICIPVPQVNLVSEYEKECLGTFLRPDSYIKTASTEIERVLNGEVPCYDMDTGDEEWLKHYNCVALEISGTAQLLEDSFEKIMFSFEKAAYNNPDAVLNQDVATGLCLDLTDKETVASVFGYWLKKRKQRRTPLVRFFQAYPLQKMHFTQGPFLRKKRSLKRQGSNLGRGKPAFYLEAGVKQEEMRKVREAETAASKAEEMAIRLRSKAQTLMSNADLLTYKSLMALRLAEAMQYLEPIDIL